MQLSTADMDAIQAICDRMIAANKSLTDITDAADAEVKGIVSYAFGHPRDTCPYVPQSDLALVWLRGWDAAHLRAHPEDAA